MGQKIWEPQVARLSRADVLDIATSFEGTAYTKSTHGSNAHV
jgi:hypothetical protein